MYSTYEQSISRPRRCTHLDIIHHSTRTAPGPILVDPRQFAMSNRNSTAPSRVQTAVQAGLALGALLGTGASLWRALSSAGMRSATSGDYTNTPVVTVLQFKSSERRANDKPMMPVPPGGFSAAGAWFKAPEADTQGIEASRPACASLTSAAAVSTGYVAPEQNSPALTKGSLAWIDSTLDQLPCANDTADHDYQFGPIDSERHAAAGSEPIDIAARWKRFEYDIETDFRYMQRAAERIKKELLCTASAQLEAIVAIQLHLLGGRSQNTHEYSTLRIVL